MIVVLWAACRTDEPKPAEGPTVSPPAPTTPVATPVGAADRCGLQPAPNPGDPVFDEPASQIVVEWYGGWWTLYGGVPAGPPLVQHEETDRVGQCRLLERIPWSCDTGICQPSDACVGGTCRTPPGIAPSGAWTLTVNGASYDLASGMNPLGEVELRGPITVAAAGDPDGVPPFVVSTCPVAPLVPTTDWEALMLDREPREDAVLTWVRGDPRDRVHLRMTTGAETHDAVAHAIVECDAADTGVLVIPGAFLEELYREGWNCGNCPSNQVIRYRRGSVDAGGFDVRFAAISWAAFQAFP